MFRPTLDRKRKSTTGLLVVVVVGLLFYFLCSIHDDGGRGVPGSRFVASGYPIRDTETVTTTSLLLKEGQTPELDMVQSDGYLSIDSGDLGDPRRWKDFSRAHDKVLEVRTRQSELSRTFGPKLRAKEPGLRSGDSSENFTLVRSHKKDSRLVLRTTRSRTKPRSDTVKLKSNSAPLESDVLQFRSNIPTFHSGTDQGLDDSRTWSRTDSASRSSTKNRFRFLIDAAGACDPHTLVLIVICSAWENASRRQVIRATWASLVDHQLRVLFIIGQPKTDHKVEDPQRTLEEESLNHGDLLQADFIDSYANLSLKSIAMLQWAEASCQEARFLVKADDDVLVNTPLLLRDLALTRHRRFVMGNVIAGARPSRDRSSKWFTPATVYPRDFYPKYISGAAYVISGDLVRDLHAASVRAEFFWIEDVFITGLLLAANGSDVINAQHIYNGKFDIQKEFIDPCTLKRRILRHLSDPTDMTALWTLITSPSACVTLT